MAGKKGKIAAGATAAAIAVGGGVAELKGLFRSGAEDVVHVPAPVHAPDITPPEVKPDFKPPDTPTIPAPAVAPSADGTGTLISDGNNDQTAKSVICFAYQQY